MTPSDTATRRRERLRALLLAWYDDHARELPWRVGPHDRRRGVRPDPYRVWLSEIMLQQTTVAAVRPYYDRFLDAFPDIAALADAPLDRVLSLWAGLGYYARARNLHACAKVVAQGGGAFPDTEADLRRLPGVGAYTAAAIAAICFDRPTNVVDGNVERVMARMHAVDAPLPGAKSELRTLADALAEGARPGDYAQALMDLGAGVCVRGTPRCEACPWSDACAGRASGEPQRHPRRAPKRPKPERCGVAFIVVREGRVLLRRRPTEGLLGGMAEAPTTPWRETGWAADEAARYAPEVAHWRVASQPVRHVFTHFRLALAVWRADVDADVSDASGWWTDVAGLAEEALPSVMRKAVAAGLAV